jgi:L-alanine-DL-glutamate epimerase-like enolase superfamily enzyme
MYALLFVENGERLMKIRKITVDVLRVMVDNAYVAAGRQVDANWHMLARVTTADGIEGIGYIVYPRGDLMRAIAQATRELSEYLIGTHVLAVEAAWERLARRGNWVGPGGMLHCAIAPLDIALWDAAGKALGQLRLFLGLSGINQQSPHLRYPSGGSDGLTGSWLQLAVSES